MVMLTRLEYVLRGATLENFVSGRSKVRNGKWPHLLLPDVMAVLGKRGTGPHVVLSCSIRGLMLFRDSRLLERLRDAMCEDLELSPCIRITEHAKATRKHVQ